jgi:hypothetical protein
VYCLKYTEIRKVLFLPHHGQLCQWVNLLINGLNESKPWYQRQKLHTVSLLRQCEPTVASVSAVPRICFISDLGYFCDGDNSWVAGLILRKLLERSSGVSPLLTASGGGLTFLLAKLLCGSSVVGHGGGNA